MHDTDGTIWGLLQSQLERRPDTKCLTAPSQGRWVTWTWHELASQAAFWAQQLQDAGVAPGERVVLWSENRWEWIVADLALQAIGAVSVPLHHSLTTRQVNELADHCNASHAIVTDAKRIAQLAPVQQGPGTARSYFYFDGNEPPPGTGCRLVREASSPSPSLSMLLESRPESATDPCRLMTILYTSGTTGVAKGVMLSQRNLMANIASKLAVLPLYEDDVRLGFLPLSHIYARTCDLYTWIAAGCQLALARSPADVFEDLRFIRPTYLNGVPYFYEKCWRQAQAENRLDTAGWLQEFLGGKIRLCNCGGAPLPDYVQAWFDEQRVTLVTGYGLTEAAPVLTSSAPGQMKLGAVGRAVPGVEIRLASDGEILARGDNIMLGYYRDPETTAATLDNEWLKTGDTGTMDRDGFVTLTGRKKELIITSGGKNIDPYSLENRLAAAPEIQQCMVVGDRRDFLVGLVVPAIDQSGQRLSMSQDQWQQVANKALTDLSRYEQIGRLVILSEPFTLENDMLTVKGSLRRRQIESHYRDAIDAAYRDAQIARAAQS